MKKNKFKISTIIFLLSLLFSYQIVCADVVPLGDNVFPSDIDDWQTGTYNIINGVSWSVKESCICSTDYILISPNTRYFYQDMTPYSVDIVFWFYNESYDKISKASVLNTYDSYTFDTPSTTKYLRMCITINGNTFDSFVNSFDNELFKIMICNDLLPNKDYVPFVYTASLPTDVPTEFPTNIPTAVPTAVPTPSSIPSPTPILIIDDNAKATIQKLGETNSILRTIFYTIILFYLLNWLRRIINKWRKGQGINE